MSTPFGPDRIGRHQGVGSAATELPFEGSMPAFDGASTWLNSPPLTPSGLRGHVVLVEFWTYTCINWLRTEPYVRAWANRYRDSGLVVIGVHTPEFGFEHNFENVRRAAEAMAIEYPIAIDNDYDVWRAFSNHYWPAMYFIDAEGRIRHHRFGEGDYERSEMVIRQLLIEKGEDSLPDGLTQVQGTGPEAAADWPDLGSHETYLGYEETVNFEAPDGVAVGKPRMYAAPVQLMRNQWALSGDWTVSDGAIALNKPNGRIVYEFHARDLHLVMGPAMFGTTVRFRVLIDSQPAREAHGADVDDRGEGSVVEQRMYQLVRQQKPIADRRFDIEFLDAGVEAFVFTFG
jgi:thiol-disulfide isomerase/thioredoxin